MTCGYLFLWCSGEGAAVLLHSAVLCYTNTTFVLRVRRENVVFPSISASDVPVRGDGVLFPFSNKKSRAGSEGASPEASSRPLLWSLFL